MTVARVFPREAKHQIYRLSIVSKHLEEEVLTVTAKAEPYNFSNVIHTDVANMLSENRRAFIRFLSRHLESTDLAEEVLQEFCLRAISKSSDIKQRESILQWLYRVLRSTLVDYWRAKAARQEAEREYSRLQPMVIVNKFSEDPEAVCTCFYQLIPALKPEYAEVLQRIDLNGESRTKVAGDLGITLTLVRVRLHRARQALRHLLLASCKGCGHGFMNCDCAFEGTTRN